MTLSNKNVCHRFIIGCTHGGSRHLFIEEDVLFSYGSHYPLAIRVKDDDREFIINDTKYSQTTTGHRTAFLDECFEDNGKIISHATTKRMLEYVSMNRAVLYAVCMNGTATGREMTMPSFAAFRLAQEMRGEPNGQDKKE